mgnify:CR=1 FL=1
MSTRHHSGDTLAPPPPPPPPPQRDDDPPALRGWHQPRLPRGTGWYTVALAVVLASALHAGIGLPLIPSLLIGWAVLGIGLPALSRAVEGRRKAVDRLVSVMVSSAFVLAMVQAEAAIRAAIMPTASACFLMPCSPYSPT